MRKMHICREMKACQQRLCGVLGRQPSQRNALLAEFSEKTCILERMCEFCKAKLGSKALPCDGLGERETRFGRRGFSLPQRVPSLSSGKPSRRARGKRPSPGVVCPLRSRVYEECRCGGEALARAVRQCARHCGNGRRRYRVGGGNVSVLSVCRPLHAGSIPRSPCFFKVVPQRGALLTEFSPKTRVVEQGECVPCTQAKCLHTRHDSGVLGCNPKPCWGKWVVWREKTPASE